MVEVLDLHWLYNDNPAKGISFEVFSEELAVNSILFFGIESYFFLVDFITVIIIVLDLIDGFYRLVQILCLVVLG